MSGSRYEWRIPGSYFGKAINIKRWQRTSLVISGRKDMTQAIWLRYSRFCEVPPGHESEFPTSLDEKPTCSTLKVSCTKPISQLEFVDFWRFDTLEGVGSGPYFHVRGEISGANHCALSTN
jgi:hypothetical protein